MPEVFLQSPALPRMVKALEELNEQPADARLTVSNNAPFAKYQINFTGVTSLLIAEAQAGNQQFSGVTVFLFSTSGAALYSILGGQLPKVGPPIFGIEIPSGNAQLDLEGQANIAALRIIATSGTLEGCYVLFV